MESLIKVVNQLQDICNTVTIALPIDLPQIVVVGTQSSGKSSVIESIVKREFLPRGSGIVTRRPLVIRLFKINDQDIDSQSNGDINGTSHNSRSGEWVKFKHLEKEFTDFDEVRQEIERETERVCGTNKGICAEPITLGVYSRNVVNLTLVDLPGLTKNPVGDQPEDIEIQIRELVTSYIKNPNSIILAVTAANTDFATSEAIKLAREVDPDGKRTLAVLTKLDIMDPGTDALEVLSGRLIMIRLGIIGVVNRTQQDIINKKPISKAIEDEAAFLQRRYPSIAEKNGQPYLSKRLSQLLMRHIRDCLPDLKLRVNSLISQYQAQLNSYGDPITDKAKTIIDIITRFSLSYCDTIKGGKRQIKTTELCGGARIQYIFHDSFGRALQAINPLDSLDNKAILTAARNAAGVRTSICVPDVFELLVTNQIKRLGDPSLRCVELVHEEMGRFVKHCGDEVHLELLRFPKLREKIEEILTKLLDERLPITREAVENLVGYGSAFIDTEHPRLRETGYVNYAETCVKYSGDSKNQQQNGITSNAGSVASMVPDDTSLRYERELRECEAIARKIAAYFNIVREEIKVFVPRAIMHCMVNHVKSNLQSALIKEIYHHDLFDGLLSESDDIARRRKETADMLSALKKLVRLLTLFIIKNNTTSTTKFQILPAAVARPANGVARYPLYLKTSILATIILSIKISSSSIMLEISTNTQIGLGLTVMGVAFLFLGVVFLFDKGLLAIGNLMFLAGLSFIIGFGKTFSFFFQWHKLKGTFAFFTGIIILLAGHPIIGVIIEFIGFYLLFRSFLPTALQYVTSFLPFFGSSIKHRSVV